MIERDSQSTDDNSKSGNSADSAPHLTLIESAEQRNRTGQNSDSL